MILRDYQEYAVQSIFNYFAEGNLGNPVVGMPTGTGKSLVIAAFARRAFELYPATRIMKLTHVKELIEQNLDKLLTLWPTAPAGVYSAGLKRKESGYPITFGGVATVVKAKDISIFGKIDLLLIDECHLVSPEDNTRYQLVVRLLQQINPNLKVIGFTATHYRMGQGLITDGGLFTDMCCDMTGMDSFNWFLDEGYLCPLVPKQTETFIDLSGIHLQHGEFNQRELQEAVDKDSITWAALQESMAYGHDRHKWLIFASGVEHTEHVAAMLDSMGIPTTFVHSKMSRDEVSRRIKAYRAGQYRAMVNNGILTTGFDDPAIDLIIILRPTQSTGLWVQILGRGTRPFYLAGPDLQTAQGRLEAIALSQKRNCLVLDFARNTERLGPINDPVLPRKRGEGGGTAPIKVCEKCGTYNHASARECCVCHTEFPRHVHIQANAGNKALIASREEEVITEVVAVDRVIYTEHRKDGSPPSIQVSYFCGLRMFREWVCLEHPGYASKRARDWWRERALVQDSDDIPATTLGALKQLDALRTPTHLRVWLRKKHDEIMAYDYTGTSFGGATR